MGPGETQHVPVPVLGAPVRGRIPVWERVAGFFLTTVRPGGGSGRGRDEHRAGRRAAHGRRGLLQLLAIPPRLLVDPRLRAHERVEHLEERVPVDDFPDHE